MDRESWNIYVSEGKFFRIVEIINNLIKIMVESFEELIYSYIGEKRVFF